MIPETTAETYRSGMILVTERVFETLLNMAVRVIDAPEETLHSPLTAAIFYAGTWKGALILECSEQQARAWSSLIMDIREPSAEDVRDGLGELANVLAGNLKPLLPPGVGISTPSVVNGTDYNMHVLRRQFAERVEFADERGPFRVTFAKADPETAER
jgi:chemotaxis protein CheX